MVVGSVHSGKKRVMDAGKTVTCHVACMFVGTAASAAAVLSQKPKPARVLKPLKLLIPLETTECDNLARLSCILGIITTHATKHTNFYVCNIVHVLSRHHSMLSMNCNHKFHLNAPNYIALLPLRGNQGPHAIPPSD